MMIAKRVIHWGPLTGMAIVISVTVCALFLSSPWLTKNNTSAFGMAIIYLFILSACTTLYNLWCAMLIGPGYLPYGWANEDHLHHGDNNSSLSSGLPPQPTPSPKRLMITTCSLWPQFLLPKKQGHNDQQRICSIQLHTDQDLDNEHKKRLKFCLPCQGYKDHRSHHCRKCDRCVLKMDHHCPWINNCVGETNQVYFIKFLFFAIVTTFQACTLLACGLYRAFYIKYYRLRGDHPATLVHLSSTSFIFTIFNLGLSAGVVVSVTGLLVQQLRNYLKDVTLIESLQEEYCESSEKKNKAPLPIQKLKDRHNHFE